MRMLLGSIFAIAALVVAFSLSVDFSTMRFKPVNGYDVFVVGTFAVACAFAFLRMTGMRRSWF